MVARTFAKGMADTLAALNALPNPTDELLDHRE